jgi:hypothetical protein
VGRTRTPSQGRIYLVFEGGPIESLAAVQVIAFNLSWLLNGEEMQDLQEHVNMNERSNTNDSVSLPLPSRRRFVQACGALVAASAAGRSLGGAEPGVVSPATTNAGRRWPSELNVRKDPVSGATVRQLTNCRAHSNHSNFTYPCVHAQGTKVLYTADPQGYGQVSIVDVPDWDALPDRSGVKKG